MYTASPCPALEAAIRALKDQRYWREAWLIAENKVDLLTSEVSMLLSQNQHRKKKETND
jgi:hypothetical protein